MQAFHMPYLPLLGLVLLLVSAVLPAAAATHPEETPPVELCTGTDYAGVCVRDTGPARCAGEYCLAASLDGEAESTDRFTFINGRGFQVAVSGTNDSTSDAVAISGTGRGHGERLGVSGTGPASGDNTAVSGTGMAGKDSTTSCSFSTTAVSGTNDSHGALLAVSGTGDAGHTPSNCRGSRYQPTPIAVSGRGTATATGLAVSGTGEASCDYELCVAVSGTGPTSCEGENCQAITLSAPVRSAPPVRDLHVAAGPGEANLTWSLPTPEERPAVAGYELWRRVDAGAWELRTRISIADAERTGGAYLDPSVVAGMPHAYKVRSVTTEDQPGPFTEPVTVSWTASRLRSPILDDYNTVAGPGAGEATVSWFAPRGENPDGVRVVRYDIYRAGYMPTGHSESIAVAGTATGVHARPTLEERHRIASVNASTFTFKDDAPTFPFAHYWIVAVDGGGAFSAFSNTHVMPAGWTPGAPIPLLGLEWEEEEDSVSAPTCNPTSGDPAVCRFDQRVGGTVDVDGPQELRVHASVRAARGETTLVQLSDANDAVSTESEQECHTIGASVQWNAPGPRLCRES